MKLRGGRVIGRVGCCRKFGRPRPRERRHRPLAAVRSDTSHGGATNSQRIAQYRAWVAMLRAAPGVVLAHEGGTGQQHER